MRGSEAPYLVCDSSGVVVLVGGRRNGGHILRDWTARIGFTSWQRNELGNNYAKQSVAGPSDFPPSNPQTNASQGAVGLTILKNIGGGRSSPTPEVAIRLGHWCRMFTKAGEIHLHHGLDRLKTSFGIIEVVDTTSNLGLYAEALDEVREGAWREGFPTVDDVIEALWGSIARNADGDAMAGDGQGLPKSVAGFGTPCGGCSS